MQLVTAMICPKCIFLLFFSLQHTVERKYPIGYSPKFRYCISFWFEYKFSNKQRIVSSLPSSWLAAVSLSDAEKFITYFFLKSFFCALWFPYIWSLGEWKFSRYSKFGWFKGCKMWPKKFKFFKFVEI